jgi:predicted transcriptional regulator
MQALEGKRGILAALDHELSDDASIEDAIDYLLYLQGIEEGLEDERAGRLIPHAEIVEMIKSWAK